jgi:cytochrome c-type biogenesis protein CcmF
MVAASLVDPAKRYVLRNGPPLTRSHWGMCIAHLGVGVFAVGASVTNAYNLEIDVAARPGDTLEAGGYQFVFKGVRELEGPNYLADEGEFELRSGDGRMLAVLTPQVRTYRVQQSPTTEAAIDVSPTRDVFLALGDPLGDNAWGVRIRIKPLISFVWFGAGIMALGGIVALTGGRRRTVEQKASAAVAPLPAEAT